MLSIVKRFDVIKDICFDELLGFVDSFTDAFSFQAGKKINSATAWLAASAGDS